MNESRSRTAAAELRELFSSRAGTAHRARDPLSLIALGLSMCGERIPEIAWLGLYFISRRRRELLLGPFYGPYRPGVRFPLESGAGAAALHTEGAAGPPVRSWDLRRDGVFLARLAAEGPLGDDELSLLSEFCGLILPFVPDFDLDDPFAGLPSGFPSG